jgi:hypothetical protein
MKILLSTICFLISSSISLQAFAGEGNQHAAIFTGITTGESTGATTIGVEYEYKLPILEKKLGIGVFYESISGDHDSTLSGIGVIYHLPHHLRTNLSIGDHASDGHHASITRVGIAYDHHIDSYAVSPTLNIDQSSHGTVSVYGVAFGKSF